MRIPLSPMDYYFFRRQLYTIQYIFEYEGHLDRKSFQSALETTMSAFPAVGARMKFISAHEIALEIGSSVQVTESFSDAEIEIRSAEDNERLVRPICNAEGEPLLSVQMTKTPTKSFVGFSFSHMLGDGKSTFQFLSELASVCQGNVVTIRSCDDRRRLLLGNGEYQRKAKSELFRATGYVLPKPAAPANTRLETVRYANGDLETMRSDFARRGITVSKNDLVMADLAKKFHSYVPLHEGKFIVRCPVDYRGTFGLPDTYFGNAIRDAVAAFDPLELDQMKLEDIALRIRRAIAGVDRESVRRSLQCLNALRQEEGFSIFEDVGCPGLIVSNWTRFPIRTLDFGVGSPRKFYHASVNPRLAIILPTDDGIEVRFKRPDQTPSCAEISKVVARKDSRNDVPESRQLLLV